MEDIDLSFPSQVIVTPKILGEAITSMMQFATTDPEGMNKLGMGLIMFVEILKTADKGGE